MAEICCNSLCRGVRCVCKLFAPLCRLHKATGSLHESLEVLVRFRQNATSRAKLSSHSSSCVYRDSLCEQRKRCVHLSVVLAMSTYSDLRQSSNSASTKDTHLIVVNESKTPLSLTWLDFSHQPRTYATVQPGKSHVQNTFSTHTWVIEGPAGGRWTWYQGVPSELSRPACAVAS